MHIWQVIIEESPIAKPIEQFMDKKNQFVQIKYQQNSSLVAPISGENSTPILLAKRIHLGK